MTNRVSEGSSSPLGATPPPAPDGGRHPWRRWIDTFLHSPDDIVQWEGAPAVPGHRYRAEPRSMVVLLADLGANGDP